MRGSAQIRPRDVRHIVAMSGVDADGAMDQLQRLALVATSAIRAAATRKLNTSRADYLKGLQPAVFEAENGVLRAVITLVGGLPNMVEHGVGPYDLRRALLRPGAPGVRISKAGFLYRVIPFRHSTPDSAGQVGPQMGIQLGGRDDASLSRAHRAGLMGANDARLAGRAAWRKAKALDATTSHPNEGTKWGDALPAGEAPKVRARHATDLFAGMIRLEKTYERSTQSSFATFRVISSNPMSHRYDAEGVRSGKSKAGAFNVMGNTKERNWTHPGIQARELFAEAKMVLERAIRGAG